MRDYFGVVLLDDDEPVPEVPLEADEPVPEPLDEPLMLPLVPLELEELGELMLPEDELGVEDELLDDEGEELLDVDGELDVSVVDEELEDAGGVAGVVTVVLLLLDAGGVAGATVVVLSLRSQPATPIPNARASALVIKIRDFIATPFKL